MEHLWSSDHVGNVERRRLDASEALSASAFQLFFDLQNLDHANYLTLASSRISTTALTMATHIRASAALQPVGRYDDNNVPAAQISSLHLNYLSLEQRPANLYFDADGLGHLSVNGPHHDNDHTNIPDIQILPTTDEILAVQRPPWMPKKSLAEAHFLSAGPPRLLDTLFRHLRYDSTESIRDICYDAAPLLTLLAKGVLHGQGARQETPSGNRCFLYQNVRIEELLAHEHEGLLVRASYSCPKPMRGQQIIGLVEAIFEISMISNKGSAYVLPMH